jgi:antitoxin (DNA-binding transcriptional repressor) of toxin-antitoxin stability system
MKQMTVSETARKFHEVIEQVAANGKEFVVVRNTQPVARIVPEAAPQTAIEAMGNLYGILADEAGAAWLKTIEDHKQKQRKARKGSLAELRNPWVS